MVRGLESFQKHFEAHTGHYVLIGGTACDVRFAGKALEFRRTRDLDIILVVEALTATFVQHFWDFIRAGGYQLAEVDAQKRFYRFTSPESKEYPDKLELFARHPDLLPAPEGLHITDIPTGDDVSSLSAILMDDDYYHFTLLNSDIRSGLHLANEVALIALKTKAFLNYRQRKKDGQQIQEVDITKHRNDVIRLAATITGTKSQEIPENIRKDVAAFIGILPGEADNIKDLLKPWGLSNISKEDIISQLRTVFHVGEAATGGT